MINMIDRDLNIEYLVLHSSCSIHFIVIEMAKQLENGGKWGERERESEKKMRGKARMSSRKTVETGEAT